MVSLSVCVWVFFGGGGSVACKELLWVNALKYAVGDTLLSVRMAIGFGCKGLPLQNLHQSKAKSSS